MKILNKFIWSKKEPSNKNDIWFDGSTWRMYTEEAWQSFTLPVDAADTLTKMLENASEVYQEKLNAGYGIIIEGNTISLDVSSIDVDTTHNIGSIELFDQLIRDKSRYELHEDDIKAIQEGKLITTTTKFGTKIPVLSVNHMIQSPTSIAGYVLTFYVDTTLYNVSIYNLEIVGGLSWLTQLDSLAPDSNFSSNSYNAIQNAIVTKKFEETDTKFTELEEQTTEQLTELSAEVSGLSEKVDELGQPIFKAVYGETKIEEIIAAYESGKVVHCDFNGLCYTLTRINNGEAFLTANIGVITYRLHCTANGIWTPQTYVLEQTSNKVTSLSESSTDTQYPSAKAVFTAISNVGKQGVIRQSQTWTQAVDKGYDYVMADIVRGAIPQANIDLLASVGIVFNAGSGYFELNGMTDLSYEEAMAVYSKTSAFSQGSISPSGVTLGGVMDASYGYYRCNVPLLPYRLYMMTQANFSYLCWNNKFIERIFLYNYNAVFVKDFTSAFDNCFRLKEVQGVIELKNSAANYTSAFLNCYSLESISLQGIKANLNFAQSARLSNASILFMINKEVATSVITITLHADAYARAMADAEITAALAAHPNVSLAKA